MSPSPRNNRNTPFEWLQNSTSIIYAIIIGIAGIFGIGYSVGIYNKEMDCKVEILELKQQYHENIQREINECREAKLQQYERSVDDLNQLVKELQKGKRAK